MSSAGGAAPAAQASIGEQCDVCGQDVPKDDMVKQELTVAGAMCPPAMTFHTACYEKAAAMWQPDPESYCTVDPLFPETGKWVVPDEARPEGWVPYEAGG
jgi:hypothetical protein